MLQFVKFEFLANDSVKISPNQTKPNSDKEWRQCSQWSVVNYVRQKCEC